MKRRGFLGLLAALPALFLPRKSESAIDIGRSYTIVSEEVEDWTDYDALAKQINRDIDAEYAGHLTAVTMDVGRPGGDETVVTAWKQEDGKFVCTHVWYPPADADMRHWVRTTDGRFLPLSEAPRLPPKRVS